MIFTWLFWRSAIERAIKTFAQALFAVLTASGVGLLDIAWLAALSTAGMAALMSVLTSVMTAKVGEEGTPSLVNTTKTTVVDTPAPVPVPQPAVPGP